MWKDKMLFILNLVMLTTIFVCQTGLSQSVDSPPLKFPKVNGTFKIYTVHETDTLSETPPSVFPDNDPKMIHNQTILETLKNHTTIKIDSEVPELLRPSLEHITVPISNLTTVVATSRAPTTESKTLRSTTENDVELDQEEIESDLSKTEDVKLNVSKPILTRSQAHQDHDHSVRNGVMQGQWAAILAGVFALIAVLAYVGLLTWRRYLEHRYGNREMLINEEEHINYNDIKNFEL